MQESFSILKCTKLLFLKYKQILKIDTNISTSEHSLITVERLWQMAVKCQHRVLYSRADSVVKGIHTNKLKLNAIMHFQLCLQRK